MMFIITQSHMTSLTGVKFQVCLRYGTLDLGYNINPHNLLS